MRAHRRIHRAVTFVLGALLAAVLWPIASAAFANVDVGDPVENEVLPTIGGGTHGLVAKGKVSVFVFFRLKQDHSVDVLKCLAEIEQEFAGRPVHFAAVISGGSPEDEVKAVVSDAGIQMPVLVDAGDRLYGKLGVRLHPVIGVVDARSRLFAYEPFMKINLCETLRARIRHALGEIGEAEVKKVVEPATATMPGDDKRFVAKRDVNLGRMLLQRQNWEKALESARRAQEHDPTFGGARTLAGQALAGMGKCTEAVAQFDEALKLDPNDAAAAEGKKSCK